MFTRNEVSETEEVRLGVVELLNDWHKNDDPKTIYKELIVLAAIARNTMSDQEAGIATSELIVEKVDKKRKEFQDE